MDMRHKSNYHFKGEKIMTADIKFEFDGRPKIKDFMPEGTTVKQVQDMYIESQELYSYINALDAYTDKLQEDGRNAIVSLHNENLKQSERIKELEEENKKLPVPSCKECNRKKTVIETCYYCE